MGRFKTKKGDYRPHAETTDVVLKRAAFERFDPSILGLGDITASSEGVEAVCAVFDLAGFTNFCRQVDPHLSVPQFMSAFLSWLFGEVKRVSLDQERDGEVDLFVPLPFFAKFMGDGVMFLWDCRRAKEWSIANMAASVRNTSLGYTKNFLPELRKKLSYVPAVLRVGMARGRVFSVGNGKDFVGPAINMASRLQKIGSTIQWCVAARGFVPEYMLHSDNATKLTVKSVSVRGIGDEELVYLFKSDYEALPLEEQALFSDPENGP